MTGAPQFVYVAAYQGSLAAENALQSTKRAVDLTALPRVTFTTPQIASVGITEEEARKTGGTIKTSILPLSAVPRALVNQDTKGLIKLVAEEKSGRILGASVLSDSAGEVIFAAGLAIKYGLAISDLADSFCPYLTMSEGLKLAEQSITRDVSKLSCCAS